MFCFMHGATTEAVAATAAEDPYATVAGIDLADAEAMIADWLRKRDATARLDDHHGPGDDPDEWTRTCGPWWISGWACCPSAVTRPSSGA